MSELAGIISQRSESIIHDPSFLDWPYLSAIVATTILASLIRQIKNNKIQPNINKPNWSWNLSCNSVIDIAKLSMISNMALILVCLLMLRFCSHCCKALPNQGLFSRI